MKESLKKDPYRYLLLLFLLILIANAPYIQFSSLAQHNSISYINASDSESEYNPNLNINDCSLNDAKYSPITEYQGRASDVHTDVFFVNNLAFVAYNDLFIFDVSNQSSPILLTKYCSEWGAIINLKVENNIAYLICDLLGIVILNVTDIYSITELGKCGYFDLENHQPRYYCEYVQAGCFSGNIAYLVTHGSRIGSFGWTSSSTVYLIDLTDPLYPKPINYIDYLSPSYVYVFENRCYIQYTDLTSEYGEEAIAILDVSNVNKIKEIKTYKNMEIVTHFENKIIVEQSHNPYLIDFTDPENPVYSPKLNLTIGIKILQNDLIYFIDSYTSNLLIIDITDCVNPITYSQFALNSKINSIHFFNNNLFLIGQQIQIIDITNYYAPFILSETPCSNEPMNYNGVFIENNRLYLFDSTSGIFIKNLSSFYNPQTIGHYFFDFNWEISFHPNLIQSFSFYVKNDFCYILRNNFFEIINCSIASSPYSIYNESFNNFDYYSTEIIVNEDLFYLTLGNTLNIYNISDLLNPINCSKVKISESFISCGFKDNFLYLSITDGLVIVNVTSANTPIITKTITIDGSLSNIFIQNTTLFGISDGIHIYNIENPLNPVLLTTITEDLENAIQIYATNDFLYVNTFDKIFIYNIENLIGIELIDIYEYELYDNNYFELHYYYTSNYFNSLFVINYTIFLMNAYLGLEIIGIDSDQDNLADYLENTIYHTNSTLIDTDFDGSFDCYEVFFGLDPLNNFDANI
nr:hypothetical protein [Asgard group archaeon]